MPIVKCCGNKTIPAMGINYIMAPEKVIAKGGQGFVPGIQRRWPARYSESWDVWPDLNVVRSTNGVTVPKLPGKKSGEPGTATRLLEWSFGLSILSSEEPSK